MEKARLFITLLPRREAASPAIDLRIFLLHHRVKSTDAGTAKRCAAHGFVANGGNTDAAGLWHAYQAARLPERKAKLLVMDRDGVRPRSGRWRRCAGLGQRLSRRKSLLSQLSVMPLVEICLSHYVLLQKHWTPAAGRSEP